MSPPDGDPWQVLAEIARGFYDRGWMMGTAGNLSLRLDDGSFWIIASGKVKGRLGPEDFLRIAPGGEVLERGHEENRPTAEVSIHEAVYRIVSDARACFHVHTVADVLVARMTDGESLRLPVMEMLKGLDIWEEEPAVDVAIFPNHMHALRIAQDVTLAFEVNQPRIPGFLIRDHGLTVWGRDADAALNHVELLEYIFSTMAAAPRPL
jgi:methylthioribulose-1-phosphate dehydratase